MTARHLFDGWAGGDRSSHASDPDPDDTGSDYSKDEDGSAGVADHSKERTSRRDFIKYHQTTTLLITPQLDSAFHGGCFYDWALLGGFDRVKRHLLPA